MIRAETTDGEATDRLPGVVEDTGKFKVVREDNGRAGDTSYPISVVMVMAEHEDGETANYFHEGSQFKEYALANITDQQFVARSILLMIPENKIESEEVILTPEFRWKIGDPGTTDGKYAVWEIDEAYHQLSDRLETQYDISDANQVDIHIKDGAFLNLKVPEHGH